MSAGRHRAGFTLIEVLAVIFIMSLILTVMLNFYMDMSNAAIRAERQTRDLRRGAALLDRVAQDLQTAFLARTAPEQDPLDNPYVFVADARYSESGADRFKFVSRYPVLPRGDGPVADHALVSYVLIPSEDEENEGGYDVLRASEPGLPEGADRDFPADGDPVLRLLSPGVADFGVRFLDDVGRWTDRWDSTQLVDSSELPIAAEITVALIPSSGLLEDAEPLTRKVVLPMRPLDLAALLDPDQVAGDDEPGDDDGDGDGDDEDLTVADCVDVTALCSGGAGAAPGVSASDIAAFCARPDLAEAPFAPLREFAAGLPFVDPGCL